jgi:hypothetical protein
LSLDFEDMMHARGRFIQKQDAVVLQGDLPQHRQLAAAAQAHSGDGVMRGAYP